MVTSIDINKINGVRTYAEIIYRKNVLEMALENIDEIIQNCINDQPHRIELRSHLIETSETTGLCDLIRDTLEDIYNVENKKQPDYVNLELDKNNILEDIQEINNITFNDDEYYSPFCEMLWSDVQSIDELKLWYEKRIECLKNTMEHYDREIANEM